MARIGRRKAGDDHRLEHVEGVIEWLIGIGIAGLVIMLLFGLGAVATMTDFATFVLWAAISALASLLVGAGLGLLFGLPTVRRVEITQSAAAEPPPLSPPTPTPTPTPTPAPAANPLPERRAGDRPRGDDVPLGYAESTNLEHVADWLTKILIGLTLTQYDQWEERLARLSYDVGFRLLGRPECTPACAAGVYPAGSTIAGGALMIFYAILGFLIAYLWMRGYFITEMEIAKRAAKEAAAKRLRDLQWAEHAEFERAKIRLDEELAKLRSERATADQARIAAEAGQTAAIEARIKAEADRVAAVEAQLKAEADATAERERFRQQGTLQDRDITFTPDSVTVMAEQVEQRAAPDAKGAAQQIRESIAAGIYPDDPWRGQFGETPERDGVRLSATVTPSAADSSYFDVALRIEGLNDRVRKSLAGKSALLFLHPTFGAEQRTVYFDADGVAPLQLLAYGAFTVGVLIETGTKLELNLATVPGVDPGFLSR